MNSVASSGGLGGVMGPSRPARLGACDVFQTDAVHWTHRNAQLASGAPRLNHRVHHLVAAKNGVGWTGVQTQRAADAPSLVNHCHGAGAFVAVNWVQRQDGQAGDGRQPLNAFSTAGRALVDGSTTGGKGLRVGGTVRVATARALCLRQNGIESSGQKKIRG